MNIKIREAVAKDREAIESIIRSIENFTDEEKGCAVELLGIYLEDTAKGEYIFICAVDEGDQPLGFICYGKTPLTSGVYDLYWIAIDPAWQGRQVGTMMVKHLEHLLKQEGARMIIAETSSQSKYEKTRLFYEKVGFGEASRVRDFYRVGDDKVIYVKRLEDWRIGE